MLHRLTQTDEGDIKKLQGSEQLRLRGGDYRVRFTEYAGSFIVQRVLHAPTLTLSQPPLTPE